MVVIQSFAVYEVPERVSTMNPDGVEVIVLVTAGEVPLELGLPIVVELGLVEMSPVDPTAVEPELGMMPPTLVEVQFGVLPLGPHTVVVLVTVVFG